MYKFTNGLVFYTKEDADKAISVGYRLVEEKKKVEKNENAETINRPIKKANRKFKNSVRKS